ncbi:hypothetical protein KCU81_g1392, partial [Aureobasidium melanogenum]|uniref:Uncharacterized protein n=1 Tax=Aureobasidium melanogenum (strain CBS 110374) TaxID=1043003 RepID=A0A074WVE5_AURM1
MATQHNTSTTQSLRDSFLTNTNAYHSKPIHPPTSQASRSQKTTTEPRTLTPEALSTLKPMDEDQAALYTHSRIIHFLHNLPDPPTDPTGEILPTPDFKYAESEPQVHYYTPPIHPHHKHICDRFEEMRRTEPHAEFHRHKAWLTLEYGKDGKVGMYVGVEDEAHADRIHKHMLWLRDKWLGYEVGLFYHYIEYEDDDDREADAAEDVEL